MKVNFDDSIAEDRTTNATDATRHRVRAGRYKSAPADASAAKVGQNRQKNPTNRASRGCAEGAMISFLYVHDCYMFADVRICRIMSFPVLICVFVVLLWNLHSRG